MDERPLPRIPRRFAPAAAAALAVLAALAAACGGSRSEPAEVALPGGTLSVAAEPASYRVGDNALWIELRDEAGAPLPGAELRVRVHMPAMGAMPAMGGPAAVRDLGDGRYRADFELSMRGSWKLEVEARRAGQPPARAAGSLTVGVPGVRLEASGGGAAPAAAHAHAEDPHPGEFRFDPRRLQRVGVTTTRAEHRALSRTVRAVGRVVAEETTLADVALKVRGWVGRTVADAVGEPVEKGDVLFTLYSPELYAAQEEYLQALRSQARARETSAPDRVDSLVRASRNRLRLQDVSDADLDRIARSGEALEQLPIRAPVSGYVVEKNVVEGSAFEPGERLYRIAPLGNVWVEAEVYEFELPLVREGQAARVELPYLPGRGFEASVAFVHPTLDPSTRTGRVRLELPNPDLALRPDMYANVRIEVPLGERLLVPQSAVLHAGERSFVFLALGEGRFRPRRVEVGVRSGEDVEIVSGLEAGEEIVRSGTFLIASESRLRAALEQW